MNPITTELAKGTFGEILVQLILLQYDVQAAPPIKDSGNDLIAVRGECFRAIQVKTTSGERININNLPKFYHILALVFLDPDADEDNLKLDSCRIFLLSCENVKKTCYSAEELGDYEMNRSHVNNLFEPKI